MRKHYYIIVSLFFLVLIVSELFFRLFFICSDSFKFTLISQAWSKKYWFPVNSFGYRDDEHTEQSLRGKKIIFVVGDSFVAGWGIQNYQDRFSNVLQKRLGSEWRILNIAQCGWATADEYEAIVSYPYKPDIIILSYLHNDIQSAAQKMGFRIEPWIKLPSIRILRYLLGHSYTLNFLYYTLYCKFGYSNYRDIMKQWFTNDMVWEEHKKELLDIIYYTKVRNIKLIIVFFSYYVPEDCKQKLLNFFQANNLTVIDLKERLAIRRLTPNVMVSMIDTHPSKKVNYRIVDILAEYIH